MVLLAVIEQWQRSRNGSDRRRLVMVTTGVLVGRFLRRVDSEQRASSGVQPRRPLMTLPKSGTCCSSLGGFERTDFSSGVVVPNSWRIDRMTLVGWRYHCASAHGDAVTPMASWEMRFFGGLDIPNGCAWHSRGVRNDLLPWQWRTWLSRTGTCGLVASDRVVTLNVAAHQTASPRLGHSSFHVAQVHCR